MTIANVQGITAASAGLSAGTSKTDSKSQIVSSFSTVMSQTGYKKTDTDVISNGNTQSQDYSDRANSNAGTESSTVRQDSTAASAKELSTSKTTDTGRTDAQGAAATDVSGDTQMRDELQGDPVDAVAEDILQVLQSALGISAEQLDGLLEQLGLQKTDLLDADNVLQVVLEQTQCGTQADLLNNEELSYLVKSMMEQINQIKEAAAVSPEPVQSVVQFAQTVSEQTPQADMQVATDVDLPQETQTTEVAGVSMTVQTEGQSTAFSQSDSSMASQQDTAGQTQQLQPTESNGTAAQNIFANLTQAVANVQSASYSGMQAMDVVTQIVTQIRTMVSADTTSMELQLQPENLGKVQIHVIAREGMITAQISAQTEAARSAIESQLTALKEAFQNQGLKVESVEVTLQPQGFDMQQQQNFEERQQTTKTRRQLRVDDIGDENDEQAESEEERIAVDMMQRSGNQVDFIA